MNEENQEVLDAYAEATTKDKKRLARWIAVVQKYLDYYGKNKFERHYEPVDILQEMIERVIKGTRNYHSDRYKSIDDFIYKTCWSIIEEKHRNKNRVEPADKCIETKDGIDFINKYEKKHVTEKEYIQNSVETEDKLSNCYNQLLEDEEAALVFFYWKQGYTSKDLSEETGLTIKQVESAKKRIRYKLTN